MDGTYWWEYFKMKEGFYLVPHLQQLGHTDCIGYLRREEGACGILEFSSGITWKVDPEKAMREESGAIHPHEIEYLSDPEDFIKDLQRMTEFIQSKLEQAAQTA